jgi:hypothetical protein
MVTCCGRPHQPRGRQKAPAGKRIALGLRSERHVETPGELDLVLHEHVGDGRVERGRLEGHGKIPAGRAVHKAIAAAGDDIVARAGRHVVQEVRVHPVLIRGHEIVAAQDADRRLHLQRRSVLAVMRPSPQHVVGCGTTTARRSAG